jgi:hypothetical protein
MNNIDSILHFQGAFDRFGLFGLLLQSTFYSIFLHFHFEALPIVAQGNFQG